MNNGMDEIISHIDNILNKDISFSLDHFDYEVIENVDRTLFDFGKITKHLKESKVLRYDFEHNATIIEIIGGYLIISIKEVDYYMDIQMCYCRHNIAIPRTLSFISV